MRFSAFSPDSVGNGFLAAQESMSAGELFAALGVSLAAAGAAALFYRFFYERRGTGSQIHRAFPLLALAVTTLFVGVQLSLPLSLGLLGSLSIIRFRTPVKEPEEVGFVMLVIAASICSATRQYAFVLYLYLFALAALVLARGAAALSLFSRDGVLVLTLPADAAAEKARDVEKVLRDHLSRHVMESSSTRNGMTTNQYVFGGLRNPAELQSALFATAPFAAVNVFMERPGGIR